MALFTVVILAGYVLPQFKPLFEELNADLPLPTRMLLFVADVLHRPVVHPVHRASCAFCGIMFWLFKTRRAASRSRTGWSLKIPIIKGIVEYAILERFCRILARDGQGRRAAAGRR